LNLNNKKVSFQDEDDFISIFNPIKSALKKAELTKDEIDYVLIIGGNNCPPYEIIDDGCCRVFNCQTTTGYIVHKDYYDVLIQNFRESANHLLREPTNHRQYALDIYWKRLQKTGAWYMILPLSVIQYENYSDIERKSTNYSWLMLDMEKRWLRGFPPK
jgi:hypothetical protein